MIADIFCLPNLSNISAKKKFTILSLKIDSTEAKTFLILAHALKAFFTASNYLALTSADSLPLPTTLRDDALLKSKRKNKKNSYTQSKS